MLQNAKYRSFCLLLSGILSFSFQSAGVDGGKNFPYEQAGLTERQAAAGLVGDR